MERGQTHPKNSLQPKIKKTEKDKLKNHENHENHENPNPQRGRVPIHVHMISILLLTVNFRIFSSIFNSNMLPKGVMGRGPTR